MNIHVCVGVWYFIDLSPTVLQCLLSFYHYYTNFPFYKFFSPIPFQVSILFFTPSKWEEKKTIEISASLFANEMFIRSIDVKNNTRSKMLWWLRSPLKNRNYLCKEKRFFDCIRLQRKRKQFSRWNKKNTIRSTFMYVSVIPIAYTFLSVYWA